MPAPISPATENEALTIALIAVMAAHIQNALGVFSLLSALLRNYGDVFERASGGGS
jgi:hypothetical protein